MAEAIVTQDGPDPAHRTPVTVRTNGRTGPADGVQDVRIPFPIGPNDRVQASADPCANSPRPNPQTRADTRRIVKR